MSGLPVADTLAVLKMLAAGRNLEFATSANPHLSSEQVRAVAQSHGYPNVANVRRAISIIEDRQIQDEVANLPSSSDPAPRPPLKAVRQEQQKSQDATGDLLRDATASPKARVQRLAKRITLDLKRLRDLIDADAAAERKREQARERREAEKRARERARQQVRDEVARLEAELKAARARLRGSRATSSKATAEGGMTESAKIRAWCAENGVEVNANGRIPASAREQYEAAQERAS